MHAITETLKPYSAIPAFQTAKVFTDILFRSSAYNRNSNLKTQPLKASRAYFTCFSVVSSLKSTAG